MRIIIVLLIGGLTLSAGLWIFFDSLVFVWAGIIGSLAKGSLVTFVLSMIKRWFLVELPKLVLKLLLRIGVPIRIRAQIRYRITSTKNWALSVKDSIVSRAHTLVGERTALTVAVLATIAVSVLTFIFFGAYILWIIGPARIFRSVKWVFGILLRPVQNFIFKVVANIGLLRLWEWLKSLAPDSYRKMMRAFVGGVIRRRKQLRKKVTEKIKNKKEDT